MCDVCVVCVLCVCVYIDKYVYICYACVRVSKCARELEVGLLQGGHAREGRARGVHSVHVVVCAWQPRRPVALGPPAGSAVTARCL